MKNLLYPLCLLLFVSSTCNKNNTEIVSEVVSMKVEMLENPIGVDVMSPRFSWQLTSQHNGLLQTAYQILVAKSKEDLKAGKNPVWDSGKISTGNSVLIPYVGETLQSRQTYYWKVIVWTNKNEKIESAVSQWSMAFLKDADWQAKWIGWDKADNLGELVKGHTRLAARYLRKQFDAPENIKDAKLYISGLGMYECYLNGKKISHDVFAPTATDYEVRVCYNVYDVSKLLTKGMNTVGVELGNGRFFSMWIVDGPRPSKVYPCKHYGFPKLLMQLEIEHTDGSLTVIKSDETWKITTQGPIIANNEFDGEEYDARLELGQWKTNGYDDSTWNQVELVEAPEGKLEAQKNPNIRVMKEIQPTTITETARGTYIIDMGQNMVGWLAVNGLQGKRGQPVKMVFAETLNEKGHLYLDNLRSAKVTDIYTPDADKPFAWEPGFVYHGFRFVEIHGLESKPALANFTGKVIYDYMEDIGHFESSNQLLNQLLKNAYWGIIGNYRSFPTDCPQRDERQGWLGDRTTGSFGESFLVNNALLYEKWLQDIEDAQTILKTGNIPDVAPLYWIDRVKPNVTWPAAYFTSAYMLYKHYGDERPIRKHYDWMKKYVSFIYNEHMEDYIIHIDNYGDWCMPPEDPKLIHSKDPARITAKPVLSTSHYYHILQLMQQYATLIGRPQEASEYAALASKVKDAYNKQFFHYETAQYDNNTVTANLISLRLGLVPEGYEERVFKNLAAKTEGELNSHISVGVIGIQHLMRGLTEYGRADLAYTIATNTDYPSWGYMIENGATTIWELWNGNTADPAMNSGNHVMLLGDLLVWYYERLAGIANDDESAGFKKCRMAPVFVDGLDYVNASYETPYGIIQSNWKRKGQDVIWDITIPANTTAKIILPKGMTITQDADKYKIEHKNGCFQFEIGSGPYSLTLTPANN